MSIGYWIVKGDKTSCGGKVLDGHPHGARFGKNQLQQAVNGSPVSCGKHPGTYMIAGGHPGDIIHNCLGASTLYSRSTCPCQARFIPSQVPWAWHVAYQDDPTPSSSTSSAADDQEPPQHAQAARKKPAAESQQNEEKQQKATREITLTIGVFFDGTGNNAINTDNMLQACTAHNYNLNDAEAEGILGKCARENFNLSEIRSISYSGYYTNVHWLNTLYTRRLVDGKPEFQHSIYIDGIGTEAGKPDSMIGQAFGTSDTGVLAKAGKAVSEIANNIKTALRELKRFIIDEEIIIKSLQFDIFGFSRGAAAARHFANHVHSEDPAIIAAISEGMINITFKGASAGKIRFIGIFDTVAAIGTPANGLNPHNANTGDVNIVLRPGVAEKVFHITAAHECRFNFALNSVKPAWPELALPGVHSDIGGGYLPIVKQNLFLTRPETDTVPLSQLGQQTRGYHQVVKQMALMDSYPAIAPIMRTSVISAETWFDDRMPPSHYGEPQKRSYAAMTLRDRFVKNDWSKVALRVMLDAAQDAGVLFEPIDPVNPNMTLPNELLALCDKAIAMGRSVRAGRSVTDFSPNELDFIAENYIHCSANWNAILADSKRFIRGGASPSEIIGFVNRPDEKWQRTIYNMDGKKHEND